jgi:hypothetical protein
MVRESLTGVISVPLPDLKKALGAQQIGFLTAASTPDANGLTMVNNWNSAAALAPRGLL